MTIERGEAADGLTFPTRAGLSVAGAPGVKPLRVVGVARMLDSPRAIAVYFDREPSDDELRVFHESIRTAP